MTRTTGATDAVRTKREFWDNVDKNGPVPEKSPELGNCWVWTGPTCEGYGKYFNKRAHRVAYEEENGQIPEGLVSDHLCRNRGCVRPSHLEMVTNRENSLRGESPTVVTMRTGICKRGHSMEGRRNCPVCSREKWARYRSRIGKVPLGTIVDCKRCGKGFPTTSSSSSYCSKDCRRETRYETRRALDRSKSRAN